MAWYEGAATFAFTPILLPSRRLPPQNIHGMLPGCRCVQVLDRTISGCSLRLEISSCLIGSAPTNGRSASKTNETTIAALIYSASGGVDPFVKFIPTRWMTDPTLCSLAIVIVEHPTEPLAPPDLTGGSNVHWIGRD